MIEIIPNKTTADIIRAMDDHQLAILFAAYRGNEFNFLSAVGRAINSAPTGRVMMWEEMLIKPIWDAEGQMHDEGFQED